MMEGGGALSDRLKFDLGVLHFPEVDAMLAFDATPEETEDPVDRLYAMMPKRS